MNWKEFDQQMFDVGLSEELLDAVRKKTEFLIYVRGKYVNARIDFDEDEGHYWVDHDGDTPNPSHYAPLPQPPEDAS